MKLKPIYKPKQYLVGFPNEILIAINNECIKQGNPDALPKIDRNRNLSRSNGGFNWHETKNREAFWDRILVDKDFYEFKNYIK